jgi:two-component system CheB/CheR fusion protein
MEAKVPEELPDRLTIPQVADIAHVEGSDVEEWVKSGRLAVKGRKERTIGREDVIRLLGELDAERLGRPKDFPIVGIGASAGGLEAVTELLQALETGLGMAYVFISHLAPDHESLLPELLQKRTGMPVHKVVDGLRVKPDHVYVIPPNANMSIVDGVLTLQKPRLKTEKGFHPINAFLVALAESYQMNAIGVILSGTATDGTVGLKAVRAGGGWTFAQDDSAKFPDMPRNAQEAGVVDFVLSPADIAVQLAELRRHPAVSSIASSQPIESQVPGLHAILVHLHRRSGVDFSQYKHATIARRILRRMVTYRFKDFRTYARHLETDPQETDLLFEDLLINVTSFFREPKFFQSLVQHVLPELLAGKEKDDPLRIWVAGCSTGEEAVSIAIILLEHFRAESGSVQIFATDLDAKMVEKARSGIYGKVALESVSAANRRTYFTKVDGKYQVVKAIRDMCVFAHHDLLKDPPFSRIDLLSCQNVLIYLNNIAQQKVLRNFHFALRPGGTLALGRSETTNAAGDLFQQDNKDYKLFSKRGQSSVPHIFPNPSGVGPRMSVANGAVDQKSKGVMADAELDHEAERLLLHRHVPASIVVDKDLEVVRFRGSTAPYLAPQAGRASLSLLKLVREDLVFELRGLLQKVKQDHAPITRSGLEIETDGHTRVISIEVAPMRVSLKEDHYLIVFLDERNSGTSPRPRPTGKQDEQDAKDRRIALLEREVRDVRDQMRVLMEEAESNMEELQTAHEEMLSSNEELQSMNEELETSKEELQSTNEELTTINDELLERHGQLKEARDYAEGIIGTISTPLVVLNANMRVRRANAAFYAAFRTTKEETEGILIHELGNHQWDVDALRKHLFDVLTEGSEMKAFEVVHSFPGTGERIFRLSAKRIDHLGVQQRLLVTMEDITDQRRTNDAYMRLAAIVTSSADAVLSLDLDGKVVTWNHGAEQLFGWTAVEMAGKTLDRLLPTDRPEEVGHLVERIRRGERISHYETVRLHKDGHRVEVSLTVSPIKSGDGRIVGISKIERDITASKAMERSLQESEMRFKLLADNMDQLAWITDPGGTGIWFNKRWMEFSGRTQERLRSDTRELHHPEYIDRVRQSLQAQMAKGETWECTFPLKRKDGAYRWFLARAIPQKDDTGTIINWFGTCTDITEMMRAEEALQQADRRKDEFLATLAHELRNPMAPLRTGLEVLQTINGDETFQHTRKVMKRQVDHLARLVEDLLDLGRINTGSLKLRREHMDPRKAMQDAAEAIEPMVRAKGQQLTLRTDHAPFLINGDPMRITQVFSNLLHNASKFTPRGGHIEVGCTMDGDAVHIHVTDNGIGIPPEQREQIFDMFTQVDPEERAKAGGGLGIGLHLVKRLVEMHSGSVAVEDGAKGNGTRFTITLPVVKDAQAKPVHSPEHVRSIAGSRVLLVDDNKDSATMLSMLLRAKGASVEVAYSGEQGLKTGESFLPDTVFMDIGMPGMDGYAACRRMRATDWGAKARIIALSGWGQEEDKLRSKEAGFDAHLVKPVERTTLLDAFQETVHRD